MADRVGQQLGNYRLIRLLGEGGFAEVYLGEHIYLGTQAAVKVLHTQLTSDDIEQFRTEARTIASLEHPHVVRILDFGVEGKTPFLVMSYAPNGTLRQRHPKSMQLPLTTIVTYVKQIADALQYAHDEKLIHRDVKPENMLVGRRNEVLLSDFGIATVAQSSRYQSTQDVIGTVAYMAPEQIQGKPRPASDQYSLGIIVYEWVSGDRPFHGSFTELCTQHMFASPPPLREKIPEISPGVELVVLTALTKEPKGRFANMKAFANALEQASQSIQPSPSVPSPRIPASSQLDQPVNILTPPSPTLSSQNIVTPAGQSLESISIVAQPNRPLEPTVGIDSTKHPLPPAPQITLPSHQTAERRFSRRTVIVGLAGLVVVGAAGGGIAWWRSSLSTPTPDPHLLYTYQGGLSVAWSPDSRRIASGESDGTVHAWHAADGGNILIYHGYPDRGNPIDVAWSVDGKFIASGSHGQVRVWNATNGATIQVFDMSTPSGLLYIYTHVALSPNSRYVASTGDTIVQVWDITNGSNAYTYHGHVGIFPLTGPNSNGVTTTYLTNGVNGVAWSPNGQRIASCAQDKTVQVWNALDGGNMFTYHGHTDSVSAVAWSPDGTRIASASKDVQVWNAAGRGNPLIYRGHPGFVNAIAWSPDSKRIVSAGGTLNYLDEAKNAVSTLHVWDAASGRNIYIYRYTTSISDVAWSPDGTRIATWSTNGTAQIWKAP